MFYILSFIVGAAAFLLFAAGKAVGGALDEGGVLPPDASVPRRIGRWINGLGDHVQVVGALALIVVAGIAGLVAFKEWYHEGSHSVALVLSLIVAMSTMFYLVGDEGQRKKRTVFTSTLIALGVVGVVLVNMFLANNASWYQVKVVKVDGKQVIPTPNGTVVVVSELFGPAWQTYLDDKSGVKNCGTLNVSSGNFELREENGTCEMRSTRLGIRRGNLARGEYSSIEEMQAARSGTPPAKSDTPLSTVEKFQRYALGLVVIGVLLLLAYLWQSRQRMEPKSADAKPPANGGH